MKKSYRGVTRRRLGVSPLGAALWILLTGSDSGLTGPPRDVDLGALKKIETLSEEIRIDYLRRAGVWTDIRTGNLDVLSGPTALRGFSFDEEVICNYHTPGSVLGGSTPKFLCEIDGIPYKVKYLPDGRASNREIFAEVASSRLFWALGFGADLNYPVRILCRGCPASPHGGPTVDERRAGRYQKRVRRLGVGLIEVRFPGVPIEGEHGDGWKWTELDEYVGTGGRDREGSEGRIVRSAAVRKHVEALKLLQVFVQHGDCKARQQRLVCLPDGVSPDGTFRHLEDDEESEGVLLDESGQACRQSFVLVDDLGATFGGAGDLTGSSAKMDLDRWAEKAVFDPEHYDETNGQCKGVLDISLSCDGGLENPIITESGRRFLLDRLNQLSDNQVRDIFVAARVDQLDNEKEGVQAWVRAFKAKVRQIENRPCRDP